jgi:hypothetical protein
MVAMATPLGTMTMMSVGFIAQSELARGPAGGSRHELAEVAPRVVRLPQTLGRVDLVAGDAGSFGGRTRVGLVPIGQVGDALWRRGEWESRLKRMADPNPAGGYEGGRLPRLLRVRVVT